MTKYFYLFVSIILFAGLQSCEDKTGIYDGPEFVRFSDTTLAYKESYGLPIQIKVHIVGKPQAEPVHVNYIVEGSAREGRDYKIEGTKGTVTIPANEYFGIITVRLINNANNILRSQDIAFTLTTALTGDGKGAIQVGGGQSQMLGKRFNLTINDDCLFGGTYNATLQGYNDKADNIEFTSINCETYTVSNWNVGVFIYDAYKPKLTFTDNGDNSLTIPRQYNELIGDTLYGTGNWDARTRVISINLNLKNGDEYQAFPTIIYTPKTR